MAIVEAKWSTNAQKMMISPAKLYMFMKVLSNSFMGIDPDITGYTINPYDTA